MDLYPFALVHICLIANQNFVDIIRGMLLNVPNPVSDVCILDETFINKSVKLFKMEALGNSVCD